MVQTTDKIEKWASMFNRAIRDWLNRELHDFSDLNDSNYYYILIVVETPGVSQRELIAAIDREQSIVTKAVRHLVASGWLRIERDPSDRRKSAVYGTDKAVSQYPVIKDIATRANYFATQGLTPTEGQELERLLKKAIDGIQ